MEFIKDVAERTRHNGKIGLFKCPFCKRKVKRPLQNGARQNGCGCVLRWKSRQRKIGTELPQNGRAQRTCLMCNKKFISRDIGNRRCPVCELRITQAAHNTYYEVPLYGRNVRSNIKIDDENN